MKRVSFDTASSFFLPRLTRLNGPDEARAYFRKEKFRFHAATAFIEETGESMDFTSYSLLFDLLAEADELISFNGRKCDLIVLESLVGKCATTLWQKPHHDLTGWRQRTELKEAIADFPSLLVPSYNALVLARGAELSRLSYSEYTKHDLANTYTDAKLTLDLFRLYEASGDTDCTYRDA